MELILKKPIVFFDLETTGTDVASDRIVEISALKLHPDGTRESKTKRINPTVPIPIEASLVHGIYKEDIEDEPPFKRIAKSMLDFFSGCDLAGYNSNKFDVPLLMEEFLRVGLKLNMTDVNLVDVQVLFHRMEPRSLSAAYKKFCGKDLKNAHSAEADTNATLEIMESMLDEYKGVEVEVNDTMIKPIVNDVGALSEFSAREPLVDLPRKLSIDDEGDFIINFGQHRGAKIKVMLEENPKYIGWIMNGDFPSHTKDKLKEICYGNK